MTVPFRNEAATQELPVAHQRGAARGRLERERETQRRGEPRLQVGVLRREPREDRDPYADVPCTD